MSLWDVALALRTFLPSRHHDCRGHKCAGDEPGDVQSFWHLYNAPCSKGPYFSPKVRAKLSVGLQTTLRKTGHGKYKDINWLRIGLFWGAVVDDTGVSF